MKTSKKCPKCQGKKLGYLESVIDYSDARSEKGKRKLAYKLDGSFWKGKRNEHIAEVEAYVCTDCGYFEEYVKNPKDLQWEQFDAFKWV